jgi:hypothetical protein
MLRSQPDEPAQRRSAAAPVCVDSVFITRDAIQEVLFWQTEYNSKVTDAMRRRGELVKTELPDELRTLLACRYRERDMP